ncbi:MAG: hypothetical protein AAGE01_13315 [Pseudomonadota bacterium]
MYLIFVLAIRRAPADLVKRVDDDMIELPIPDSGFTGMIEGKTNPASLFSMNTISGPFVRRGLLLA